MASDKSLIRYDNTEERPGLEVLQKSRWPTAAVLQRVWPIKRHSPEPNGFSWGSLIKWILVITLLVSPISSLFIPLDLVLKMLLGLDFS